MGARQPYRATFRIEFPRAGRVRNLAGSVAVVIDPARQDPDDIMPALHQAIGSWLVSEAPGMRGQDLELIQEHVDPPAGFMRLNGGLYGGGTWAQTSTTPITPTQETT
ncbi:hypothetical protein [Kocuria rhizophila]|uniref:hypothetical protein n=1 Tax=Kocuria rhizophila TaxID=72000 RepID=UPI00190C2BB5|nr:hypothetical protein [Kocuria rhizophila]MBK4119699.1 hypothetical protein [Kocuria rhizophila]